MNEELETLCQVQKIDTKIIENEKKRAVGPQKIEEMQNKISRTREKTREGERDHRGARKGKKEEGDRARRGKGAGQEGRGQAP